MDPKNGNRTTLILLYLWCFAPVSAHAIIGGYEFGSDENIPEIAINLMPFRAVEPIHLASDNGTCTAVKVGPRVLLTAGHCAHGASPEVIPTMWDQFTSQLIANKSLNTGDPGPKRFDVAFGFIKSPDKSLTFKGLVSICAPQNEKSLIGKDILFVGFGCTEKDGLAGHAKFATSKIREVAGAMVEDQATGHYGGISCKGDSGGAHFLTENDGSICLLSINYLSDEDSKKNQSTNLTMPEIRDWLESEAKAKNLEICGINKSCAPVTLPNKAAVFR